MMSSKKLFLIIVLICVCCVLPSCTKVNTVSDPSFDRNGFCLDSVKCTFSAVHPGRIYFYVETSGSMNGFFRSNQATAFKRDVWSIISNFGNEKVLVFSDTGTTTFEYNVSSFRNNMNSGAFVSNKETLVPDMIHTILDTLDYSNGECAVLISDMKYSPVCHTGMNALLEQYQADVRNEIGNYSGLSACLIMATSQYYSKNGSISESESPYYYVILGEDSNVAFMRNCISTILEENGTYSDGISNYCIETGFDYRTPVYSFGIPENSVQINDQPAFKGYVNDTCTLRLMLDLSDYRWIIAEEDVLRDRISVKSKYGSSVSVGNIKINTDNHYNKELKRKVIAEVEIKVYDMFTTSSDVIEWTLNHPEYTSSEEFIKIITCTDESDLSGSYSVDRFVAGVFNAIQNHWDKTPNRILISKSR